MEKLIVMEKDGQLSEVHPDTVKSHEAVGWVLSDKAMPTVKAAKAKAEDAPVSDEKPAPKNGKGAKAAEAATESE